MIYFDNSATSLRKPPEVAEAVAFAVNHFGNPGRSFHDATALASREIYNTRKEIAKLIGSREPLNIAFTSSATESLNLVISGLIKPHHSVITTVLEHNSVLRPLYLTGCDLSFIGLDKDGVLDIASFDKLVRPSTKFMVVTHGSNLTGDIVDTRTLYKKCKEHGILLIVDIAQTFGSINVDMDMADIYCFTGHKALFGPQGTGGIIVNNNYREVIEDENCCSTCFGESENLFNFEITKTGGTGSNSFDHIQQKCMPDIFEAGTLNSHGIYGLQKGVRFVNQKSIDKIQSHESFLADTFYEGVSQINGLRIFGDFKAKSRLPIVSLLVKGMSSNELAEELWVNYSIATRSGSHCAPLLHKHFGTAQTGLVRFSFSYFNTEGEVHVGISALKEIAGSTYEFV